MFTAHRYLSAGLLGAAVLITASACASQGPLYGRSAQVRGANQFAYERGVDEGREKGEEDARRRRSFDYERHGSYRDADEGYRGGDRNAYRAAFRQGFMAGYSQTYRQYAGGTYGTPPPYGYPNRAPVYGRAIPRYSSVAAETGFRDGLDQGRKDARDRRRFDPVRASRYRSGDHDYDRRYGSRDEYQREYRAAFLQGYEAGYRTGD
jgi:hypothetical protein